MVERYLDCSNPMSGLELMPGLVPPTSEIVISVASFHIASVANPSRIGAVSVCIETRIPAAACVDPFLLELAFTRIIVPTKKNTYNQNYT